MKKTRLFVGGLPWSVDDDDLKTLFEKGDMTSKEEGDKPRVKGCGPESVKEASVVKDRETGRSRGFAFVTMVSLEEAEEAVRQFNGISYQGRTLKVDEAADQGSGRREGGFSGRRGSSY